jgi:replicative DNA helicase
MSAVQLVNRIISAEAEIEADKIRRGKLEPHEWQQLHTKIKGLFEAPIFVDDTPALSILELRAKCRRLKAQKDIQLIVIDYLQLMTGDSSGKGASGNREQEIAQISRALKQLAKELDVPVIALSQLNRSTETRGGNKKPQLSDLRESGAIEQDADQVMFIYRPEYYGITADDQGNSLAGMGEIIMAKNRSGSLDSVWLKFIGKFTKYCDLDFQPFGGGEGGENFNLSALGDQTSTFEQGNSDAVFKGSKMNLPPEDFDPLNSPF